MSTVASAAKIFPSSRPFPKIIETSKENFIAFTEREHVIITTNSALKGIYLRARHARFQDI
jgi:hypothetical protein